MSRNCGLARNVCIARSSSAFPTCGKRRLSLLRLCISLPLRAEAGWVCCVGAAFDAQTSTQSCTIALPLSKMTSRKTDVRGLRVQPMLDTLPELGITCRNPCRKTPRKPGNTTAPAKLNFISRCGSTNVEFGGSGQLLFGRQNLRRSGGPT
jgi:hypothetical protein